jgi:alkylation response protein AidB-like acyl-CoA dehydrogenase
MALELLAGGEPLRSEVRAFLSDHPARDDPHGYDESLWAALGRTGWLSAPRLGDLAVLLSELGRARVPTPVQNGVVQLLAAASVEGVADATVRAALCLAGPDGAVAPGVLGARCRAAGDGDEVVVDGVKGYVPYADSADVFLVATDGPGDGVSLVTVPAGARGLAVDVLTSIGGDRQATVSFAAVAGRASVPLGAAWERVARAVLVGAAGLCSEAVGASAAMIERTAAHAAWRHQFGGPIGRLQAVQHRMADMAIDHLAAAGAVEEAFACLDGGRPAGAEVAAAKSLCGSALLRVAASAHQVCGGSGYLASFGLHEWTRRIKGAEAQLGGTHAQRLAIVAALRERDDWSTHSLDLGGAFPA